MDGDFFIAAAVGTTLTKLALRYGTLTPAQKRNRFDAEVMLVLSGIMHLGKSGLPAKAITNDDRDHLLFCLRVLSERTPIVVKVFTEYCRNALNEMLIAEEAEEATFQKAKQKVGAKIQPDDPIPFIQLQADRSGMESDRQLFVCLHMHTHGSKRNIRRIDSSLNIFCLLFVRIGIQ